jgi:hypothetical protein
VCTANLQYLAETALAPTKYASRPVPQVRIYLNSNSGIHGTFPTSLGMLTNLGKLPIGTALPIFRQTRLPTHPVCLLFVERLYVTVASITGPIPTEIGQLTKLGKWFRSNTSSSDLPCSALIRFFSITRTSWPWKE